MLEDAAAIRKVVIACGYVDLRKGIDGLSMIIGDRYRQNPFEKAPCFYSVAGGRTGARGCSGWGMGSCFSISVWNPVPYPGPVHRKKRQS